MRKNASVTPATRQLHKLKFQVHFSYFEIHLFIKNGIFYEEKDESLL